MDQNSARFEMLSNWLSVNVKCKKIYILFVYKKSPQGVLLWNIAP